MINEHNACDCSCMYTIPIPIPPVIPGVSQDKEGHFPELLDRYRRSVIVSKRACARLVIFNPLLMCLYVAGTN